MIYNEKLLNTIKSESYVSLKIEKRVTGKKGAGLFAKEKIYKDEIVSISGGIIIPSEIWEDFREELVILDALKIACKSNGFENYIKVFDLVRVKLLKMVKDQIAVAHD
jgi:hypothetical protein